MLRSLHITMAAGCSLIYLAVLCTLVIHTGAAVTEVDLSGSGCDHADGYYLKNADDIISLHPRQQSDTTYNSCNVTIRTDQGHRIEYLIDTIEFVNCGVEIKLLDNTSNAIQVITCANNKKVPIHGKTDLNFLLLQMRKTTTESYSFSMRIKNDLGPPFSDAQDPPTNLLGDGIDPGAIAGIGVAGAVIVIGLILLAIYCCIRARGDAMKDQNYPPGDGNAESSVYTTGTSQAFFTPGSNRYPKGKYGSMEDIRSSSSSQDKTNGAYANPAYTKEPGEKKSERHASFGRAKAGFANDGYDAEDTGYVEQGQGAWEERDADTGGSKRMSRRDGSLKPAKSALKKPSNIEMGQMGDKPANGILKTRTHSPNRSQTSSTDASLDANAMIYGYSHLGKDQPNIIHKPKIERRRSRSGTRSHRSGSSGGHSRRSQSPDKKQIKNSRMYTDVFIDDRSSRSRSSGRRARSESSRRTRSERTSDSVDSGSSTASQSRKVSMNPSGKRVHIKGEETDI